MSYNTEKTSKSYMLKTTIKVNTLSKLSLKYRGSL